MHVSVEATKGLERSITVEVPEEHIAQEVQKRLKSLAGRVKLDGFRPGKVPLQVVEQRFKGQVREEVVRDTLRSSFEEAVAKENLRPAGGTDIKSVEGQPGRGLSYKATFEVYPEINLASFEGFKVTKPEAAITEQDVDKMLETLRKQRQGWQPADREARDGDQLQVSFTLLNEEGEQVGPDSQTSVVLGASILGKDIEAKLLGLKAGSDVVIEKTAPANHPDPARASKTERYRIKLISLFEPILPELDEAFIRDFGIESGSLDELRVEVRANMQRELIQAVKDKIKQQVIDWLYEAHPIEIPRALIENEAATLLNSERNKRGLPPAAAEDIAAQRAAYESQARHRVALGLLLAEIIRNNGIKVDPAQVRASIEAVAATYEDPQEVIQWYYGTPQRLNQIESLVLEDQVVEWLLKHAEVATVASSFDAIIHPELPGTSRL
ncbi:MAG: trigger factor [Gammaproteobacteria bacterium]|nr:trigger factor [Gammaproteobacteria bacterium]